MIRRPRRSLAILPASLLLAAGPLAAQDSAAPLQGPTEDGETITVQPRAASTAPAAPSPVATSVPTYSLPPANPAATPAPKVSLPAVTAPATTAPATTAPASGGAPALPNATARAAPPPSGAVRAPRSSRTVTSSAVAVAPAVSDLAAPPTVPAIVAMPDTAPGISPRQVVPAAETPKPQTRQQDDSGSGLPLAAGVLALVGLAGAAAYARRRRPNEGADEDAIDTRAPAEPALEPVQPGGSLPTTEELERPAFPSAAIAEGGAESEPRPAPLPSPRIAGGQSAPMRPLRVLYGREALEAFSRPPRRPQTVR